jgi:hypothetical protein
LKVLHLANYFFPEYSGTTTRLYNLISRLPFPVELLTSDRIVKGEKIAQKEEQFGNVAVKRLPLSIGALGQGSSAWRSFNTVRGDKKMLAAATDKELFWGGAIAFNETQKKILLNPEYDWDNLNSSTVVKEYLAPFDKAKPEADFIERMIYLELKHRLPELLLMRVDKITMATSVEGRAPYLDHNLVEFAMGIPGELKVKNGQTKYILKKAVEGIIPDNIIYPKKQGFGARVKEWFGGELGQYITEGILTSKIKERGFFNYDYLADTLARQRRGEIEMSAPLWIIFNLCKWYDYWIAGDK